MLDCLFCKIITGDIPSKKLYEDDIAYVFEDIDPKAPTHLLIIPKKHLTSLDEMAEDDVETFGHLLYIVKLMAEREGLSEGYRVVINTGKDGGQTVDHCHIHLLGGRSLNWPPG